MKTQPIEDDRGHAEAATGGPQRRATVPAPLRLLELGALMRSEGEPAPQPLSESPGAPDQVALGQSALPPAIDSGHTPQRSVLVGQSVVMHVAMQVPGRLVIDGLVSGEIDADEIELRPGGRLEGRVSCRRAEMSGHFQGELFARDRIVARSGARICGLLVYGQAVQVESGTVINAAIGGSEAGLRKLGEEPRRPRAVEEVATEAAVKDGRHSIFDRVLGAMGIA